MTFTSEKSYISSKEENEGIKISFIFVPHMWWSLCLISHNCFYCEQRKTQYVAGDSILFSINNFDIKISRKLEKIN